ncbi:MAG: O-antigen ligase family protein [Clostridia bacterium]|nr:O-antigen ligase family protein [Clostridia bacterium]
MQLREKWNSLSFAQVVLYASFFFVGIFHEYQSCVLAIALLVWLIVEAVKHDRLTIEITWPFIAAVVLMLGYAVTPLWAIDRGEAVFGFFKFLPLPLYGLVLMQRQHDRERIIRALPYISTVITVISIVCMFLPGLGDYFAVSGRLSGLVQYPNTFAMMLLVSELVLITGERLHKKEIACTLILLIGIVASGSRTVFVLAVLFNVLALIFNKNKKVRVVALASMVIGVLLVFAVCLLTGNIAVVMRYFKISLTQSTFVGRLLYISDAWPMMLKYPFGMGFLGYHYVQQSIQTGVYAVRYIHNDLLQIVLDVGWIPALVLVFALIRSVCAKETPVRNKLVLAAMTMHACFDFDWQYLSVFLMAFLFMTAPSIKTVTVTRCRAAVGSVGGVLTAACVYFGIITAAIRFERFDVARALYPVSTQCEIALLQNISDPQKAEVVADRLLARNPHVAVAYSVKARSAYARGDFGRVIEFKRKALQAAPFSRAEYVEYGYMLVNGVRLYQQANDADSAGVCKKELINIARSLTELKEERLSEYGAMIDTQMNYSLPSDLASYIKKLEEE